MVRNIPLTWMCLATVFLWSCKDKPKVPDNPQRPAVVAAVDPAAGLPVAGNIAEQLQVESAARSKDGLKVEAVVEALGKADVPISNTMQYVARTVLATYCFGGVTGKATAVSICEYPTPEAAKAGMEFSTKQFGSIPNRILAVNKTAMLTLARGTDSPESKAEAEKAIEAFTKL